MEDKIKDGYRFSVNIQKKNPKKNPKSYKLETVQDIFNLVTEKNINKFMREFKMGMRVGIANRELMKSIAKQNNIEWKDELLQMPSFTWIDD